MNTRAVVNIAVKNNASWEDAFRFGTVGDTTWSFAGKTFLLEVKASRDDLTALLELTTANSRIIVDDNALRVLHFDVTPADLRAALPVGTYEYDLIMIDGTVRTNLMGGDLTVCQGVSGIV